MLTISTKSTSHGMENVCIFISIITKVILTLKFLADVTQSLMPGIQKLGVTQAAQQRQQELLKQVAEQQFVPKDPPPEFEFIADPPSISALDL